MSGIKDLMSLQYWLNNEKKDCLESSLSNHRPVPRDRMSILRELEIEGLDDKMAQKLGKKITN